MISSMTGFARLEHSGSFGQLTCEVRSVNHRYLEPGFRLPEELRALERASTNPRTRATSRQDRLHDPLAWLA